MLSRGIYVSEALLQDILLVDCTAAGITEDLRHDIQCHFRAVSGHSAKLAELSRRQWLIGAYRAPSLVIDVQR